MDVLFEAADRGDLQALQAAYDGLPVVEEGAQALNQRASALGLALFNTICNRPQCKHPLRAINCIPHFESFEFLLGTEADVNGFFGGGSCLHKALTTEVPMPFVQALTQRGANIEAQNVKGERPLHIAVDNNIHECVSYLCERGAMVDCRNVALETPLHVASKNGFDALVELLVSYGAAMEVRNRDGSTPLHLACDNMSERCAQVLLEHEASMECRDHALNTPLLTAVSQNSVACVALLINRGAALNALNLAGDTALLLACQDVYSDGNLTIFQLLIGAGADANVRNVDGDTPLHLVCDAGCPSVMEVLLGAHGINPNATNHDGETALHTLASAHFDDVQIQLQMVRRLVSVIDRTVRDNDGQTAAEVASHPRVARFLSQ